MSDPALLCLPPPDIKLLLQVGKIYNILCIICSKILNSARPFKILTKIVNGVGRRVLKGIIDLLFKVIFIQILFPDP